MLVVKMLGWVSLNFQFSVPLGIQTLAAALQSRAKLQQQLSSRESIDSF